MSGGGIAAGLAVEGLSLRLGAFALQDIDLLLAADRILAILGRNGAGKSVTLETIAGFHRPRRGRVVIAGCDATALPPERRQVSLMPQNYALFPHLTIAANIALPMRFAAPRGARKRLRQEAATLLARFGIAHLADRLPHDLSPGQKQRAALARAVAAQPLLFLFDEPFSALDMPTRETLRDELKTFLRGTGIPAVFVTHDVAEALGLADRLAIIEDGRIIQQGGAEEVYRAPADAAVARLLGVENILAARLIGREGAEWRVALGDAVLRASVNGYAGNDRQRAVSLAIRGEDLALSAAGARPGCDAAAPNRLAARVQAVTYAGALTRVSLDCGFPLVARVTQREARQLGLAPGMPLIAEIAAEAIHLLE